MSMHYIDPACTGPELCTVDICTCKSEVLRQCRKLFAFGFRHAALVSVLRAHGISERGRPPAQDCRVYIMIDRYSLDRRLVGNQYDKRYDAVLYLGLPGDIRNHEEFFQRTLPVGFTKFTYGWTIPLEEPGAWRKDPGSW